jgi:hypothetical protein
VDIDWDGGDITIDRDEINIGGGDRIDIGDRGDSRLDVGERGDSRLDVGERGDIGERGERLGDDRRSIGDLDRPEIAGIGGGVERPGAGTRRAVSSPATPEAARQKIDSRQSFGGGIATLPSATRTLAGSARLPAAGPGPRRGWGRRSAAARCRRRGPRRRGRRRHPARRAGRTCSPVPRGIARLGRRQPRTGERRRRAGRRTEVNEMIQIRIGCGVLAVLAAAAGAASAEPARFGTPDAAVAAPIAALEARDRAAVLAIFGPENEDIISTG